MLVLLVAGVLAAWILQYIVYQRCWYRQLDVTIEFADQYALEGDTSCLRETIANGKRLPLPALEVRLAMSRNLRFSGEAKENSSISDQNYKRDIFSFFGRQTVIRRLPFVCGKRGFYRITKSDVVGYDLFYRHSYYQEREQDTQFYVYPGPVDAGRLRLVCQAVSGMVVTQDRQYPDPFEFSGIREYNPTDPMNRINWKASARTGGLMVNQHDSTTSVKVTVVLDVEDPNILKYEELTEESIRIASSLAARLVRSGMELDITGNAVAAGEDGSYPEGMEEDSMRAVGHDRRVEDAAMDLRPEEMTGASVRAAGHDRRIKNVASLRPEGVAASGARAVGHDRTAGRVAMHLRSGAQLQELNRRLARIVLSDRVREISGVLAEELAAGKNGRIFILISKNESEEAQRQLAALAARGNQVMWVQPVHPWMEENASDALWRGRGRAAGGMSADMQDNGAATLWRDGDMSARGTSVNMQDRGAALAEGRTAARAHSVRHIRWEVE